MKRKQRFIIFNIIALSVLAVIGGIAESIAASLIPPRYLFFVWPVLVIVAIVSIGLSIWQYRLQDDENQLTTNPRQQLQNRQRMIEKVHAFWIEGVLEKSLHNAALIALGLHEKPSAVKNPWNLVLQLPDEESRKLPAGTRITDVYDKASGELLILGEPGSGKTTLMLELARDLLDRAEKDQNLKVPVIFNLSSWSEKDRRIPFTKWLIDELNKKYQVQPELGESWIHSNEILPLLDGLDEVNRDYREECVKAINAYRNEHGIVPTVVCCRHSDYLALKNKLSLSEAVVVQPLTSQQIDDYLSSADGQLAPLRVALRQDAVLRKLATTPLMLSILTLAYQGISFVDILTNTTVEKRRRKVFEKYVQRMLHRRGENKHYSPGQTNFWLSWLANRTYLFRSVKSTYQQLDFFVLPKGWSQFIFIAAQAILQLIVFVILPTFVLLSTHKFDIVSIVLFIISANTLPKTVQSSYFYLTSGGEAGLVSLSRTLAITGRAIYLLALPFFFLPNQWNLLTIGMLVIAFVVFNALNFFLAISHTSQPIIHLILLTSLILFFIPFILILLIISPTRGLIFLLTIPTALLFSFIWVVFERTLYPFFVKILLSLHKSIPWNYQRFLDYAEDCILLRKEGSDYVFIHELLKDYFASLNTTAIEKGHDYNSIYYWLQGLFSLLYLR